MSLIDFVKKPLRAASQMLPDRLYIRLKFKINTGYWPDLKNPKTFNEKLQWMKMHDRDPGFADMVDKHAVKQIVSERIGEEYVVPEYGVWNDYDEIDFDVLPNQFVLKTTHDCGGIVICKDKKTFDYAKAKAFLKKHQKQNYFYEGREWPYKNVQPRILAEAFIGELENCLVVYKVLCFHGQPKIIQVIQDDKTKAESIDYFDADWNLLDFRQNYPNSYKHMPRPENLKKMLELSGILAQERPFLRVDWYVVGDHLKFSEFTFYSDAGWAAFEPKEWDDILGGWIRLSTSAESR